MKVKSLPKLFAPERRTKISEYLNEHKRATVKELCKLLNVTPATLRSDLEAIFQSAPATESAS